MHYAFKWNNCLSLSCLERQSQNNPYIITWNNGNTKQHIKQVELLLVITLIALVI